MSERYSEQVKQKAVAEVVLGLATMTQVAARYKMSIGHLSNLCAKSRNALQNGQRGRKPKGNDRTSTAPVGLAERVEILEQQIKILFQLTII